MIGITNRAGVLCEGFVAFDQNAVQSYVLVVKRTYAIRPDNALRLDDVQAPIVLADQYWGESGDSSVRYDADVAYSKPCVDIVVNGAAWAPRGRPTDRVLVQLATRAWTKRLLVSGDRHWSASVAGIRSTSPEYFLKIPLCYERAFGGIDPLTGNMQLSNPVGRGFRESQRLIDGTLLPNIENPADAISRWSDRPASVGFSTIGRSWIPRRNYSGTYDDAWKRERFPLLPRDFDERYFMSTPEDQHLTQYVPGEVLVLDNMSAEGRLLIELPDAAVSVYVRSDRRRQKAMLAPDTVIIEPDLARVIVSGRLKLPLGHKPDSLREVIVGEFGAGEERAWLARKSYLRADSELFMKSAEDELE